MFTLRKDWLSLFTSASVKHIAYNYSNTELGKTHPKIDVGWAIRDQGQLDLFSGKSRIILQDTGTILIKSNDLAIIQERIAMRVADIKNFYLNNKHLNAEIFHKDKLPIFNTHDLKFVGPETFVRNNDGSIGVLEHTVDFNTAVTLKSLFESDPVQKTKATQTLDIYKEILNGL